MTCPWNPIYFQPLAPFTRLPSMSKWEEETGSGSIFFFLLFRLSRDLSPKPLKTRTTLATVSLQIVLGIFVSRCCPSCFRRTFPHAIPILNQSLYIFVWNTLNDQLSNDSREDEKRGGGTKPTVKYTKRSVTFCYGSLGTNHWPKRKKRRYFLVGIQEREKGADLESERKSQSS
jgi:hypothetical protein